MAVESAKADRKPTVQGPAGQQRSAFVVSRLLNGKDLDELDRTDAEWSHEEGWPTDPGDIIALRSLDSVGRFVGKLDGEVVSMISCACYSECYAFLTAFMTKKGHRGQGYGGQLLDTALAFAGERTVCLICTEAVTEMYAKKGFVSDAQIGSYVIDNLDRFTGFASHFLLSSLDVPPDQLADFDEKYFPARRQDFLQGWIRSSQSIALAYMDEERMLGYGVLTQRADRTSGRLGPLFADRVEVACELVRGLLSRASKYDKIYFDVLESNANVGRFAAEFNLVQSIQT